MSLKPPSAGNSPVLRTNVTNVQDYGVHSAASAAVNTAALNDALADGGFVYLPPGDYEFDGGLLVPDDTTFYSEGPGATLTLSADLAGEEVIGIQNSDIASGNSRCHVHNVRVIGAEDGTLLTTPGVGVTPRGIYFARVTDGSITDCHVSRWHLQGIQADRCTRLRITGNVVTEIKGGNGISVDDSAVDVVVANNNVADVADCGIGTHNGSTGTIIKGNTVTNTSYGRGIDVYGAPDTLVEGNILRQVGGNGSSGRGIQIDPGLGGTIPHRCHVVGNKIYQPDDQGILVDATAQINDVSIVGNQIIDPGTHGIGIAGLVNGVDIVGNRIRSATGPGIYVEESGGNIPTGVWIDGNSLVDNSTFGVLATAGVVGLQFGANYFSGNGSQATNVTMPTMASTAAATLPVHSGVVLVTGTANITSIVTGYHGERVTLLFSGTAGGTGVTDGSNLKIAGNLVYTPDDTLTLVCDGANWYESGRGVS